jgi:hypothetical protein
MGFLHISEFGTLIAGKVRKIDFCEVKYIKRENIPNYIC